MVNLWTWIFFIFRLIIVITWEFCLLEKRKLLPLTKLSPPNLSQPCVPLSPYSVQRQYSPLGGPSYIWLHCYYILHIYFSNLNTPLSNFTIWRWNNYKLFNMSHLGLIEACYESKTYWILSTELHKYIANKMFLSCISLERKIEDIWPFSEINLKPSYNILKWLRKK